MYKVASYNIKKPQTHIYWMFEIEWIKWRMYLLVAFLLNYTFENNFTWLVGVGSKY